MDMGARRAKPEEKILAFKRRKAPEVKQTLASKFRMLNANPLLMFELGKNVASDSDTKRESIFKPLRTLVSVMDASMGAPATSKIEKNAAADRSVAKIKAAPKTEWKKPLPHDKVKMTLEMRKKLLKQYTIVRKNQRKDVHKSTPSSTSTRDNDNAVVTDESSGRSQDGVEPNNKDNQEFPTSTTQETRNPEILIDAVKTSSESTVPVPKKIEDADDLNNREPSPSPMRAPSTKQALTPSDSVRRSIIFATPTIRRKSMAPLNANSISMYATPNKRTTLPISNSSSKDMARRLSQWLQRRGKSAKAYQHLQCFGVGSEEITKAEEKENVEENKPPSEEFDPKAVVMEALMDLHKLILDGYPPEQCETWLRLIKQKDRAVQEKPQYWECYAAIEQNKGNIDRAVTCYENAIIQGAELQTVDKCLDQLLQKFRVLEIDDETDASSNNKPMKDFGNIFKSRIIQFAVQQKTFKKKVNDGVTVEKKMIATPVRRSTRVSRSAFTSTPGVQIYSSMKEFDSSVNFECNKALND